MYWQFPCFVNVDQPPPKARYLWCGGECGFRLLVDATIASSKLLRLYVLGIVWSATPDPVHLHRTDDFFHGNPTGATTNSKTVASLLLDCSRGGWQLAEQRVVERCEALSATTMRKRRRKNRYITRAREEIFSPAAFLKSVLTFLFSFGEEAIFSLHFEHTQNGLYFFRL